MAEIDMRSDAEKWEDVPDYYPGKYGRDIGTHRCVKCGWVAFWQICPHCGFDDDRTTDAEHIAKFNDPDFPPPFAS